MTGISRYCIDDTCRNSGRCMWAGEPATTCPAESREVTACTTMATGPCRDLGCPVHGAENTWAGPASERRTRP